MKKSMPLSLQFFPPHPDDVEQEQKDLLDEKEAASFGALFSSKKPLDHSKPNIPPITFGSGETNAQTDQINHIRLA